MYAHVEQCAETISYNVYFFLDVCKLFKEFKANLGKIVQNWSCLNENKKLIEIRYLRTTVYKYTRIILSKYISYYIFVLVQKNKLLEAA